MVIVNYRSKRQLKKAIGQEGLDYTYNGREGKLVHNGSFSVTNMDGTFKATVVMANGVIESVR